MRAAPRTLLLMPRSVAGGTLRAWPTASLCAAASAVGGTGAGVRGTAGRFSGSTGGEIGLPVASCPWPPLLSSPSCPHAGSSCGMGPAVCSSLCCPLLSASAPGRAPAPPQPPAPPPRLLWLLDAFLATTARLLVPSCSAPACSPLQCSSLSPSAAFLLLACSPCPHVDWSPLSSGPVVPPSHRPEAVPGGVWWCSARPVLAAVRAAR